MPSEATSKELQSSNQRLEDWSQKPSTSDDAIKELARRGLPPSLPPSGPADGDLRGNYPNPTIRDYTIDQTSVAAGNTGSLTQLLSWLANMVWKIIGPSLPNWFSVPPIDLVTTRAHVDAAAPHSGHEKLANKDQPGGYLGLGLDSKIPNWALPPIAITDTFPVNSQEEMLTLVVQTGDVAVRLDLLKSFILRGTDPTQLSHWQELLAPPGAVLSVNGQTGVVNITALPPNGAAGGDLSGNYPNPAIGSRKVTGAKIALNTILAENVAENGLTIDRFSPAGGTNGMVIGISGGFVTWVSNSTSPSGSAGGDLSGTYPNPTVARLQGRAVNNAAPQAGEVLAWDTSTSQWRPTPDSVKLPYSNVFTPLSGAAFTVTMSVGNAATGFDVIAVSGTAFDGDVTTGTAFRATVSGTGNCNIWNIDGTGTSTTTQRNFFIARAAGIHKARLNATGQFFGAQYITGGADIAEAVVVTGPLGLYPFGSVLQHDPDNPEQYCLATAGSTLITGVVRDPALCAVLCGVPPEALENVTLDEWLDAAHRRAMAVLGLAPIRVNTSGGPIGYLDSLIASSTPGEVTTAGIGVTPAAGSIVGRALIPYSDPEPGIIPGLIRPR